jgi:hypothetical protein
LSEKNICINVDSIPELQEYFSKEDHANEVDVIEKIALLECNLHEVDNFDNLDNKLDTAINSEVTRIIMVVKGEQILLEDRCDFLLLLEKYCRDKNISYAVNAHSTTYSEERHVTCHLTLK